MIFTATFPQEYSGRRGDKSLSPLLETALTPFYLNFIVCPFKLKHDGGKVKKTPLMRPGDLDRWRKEGQSIEEKKNLEWRNADGLGIFLEKITLNNETFYPIAIDVDAGEDFWRPYLKHLPITHLEKTPRGGLHAFYLSKHPPERSMSIDLGGGKRVEFLYGKWVIIYPSSGYQKLNDSSWRVVEDAYSIFLRFTAEVGGSIEADGPRLEEDDSLKHLKKKFLDIINDRIAYRGSGYLLIHCPLHAPDKNPSMVFYNNTNLIIDFHDGRKYLLKDFLEKYFEVVGGREEDGKSECLSVKSLREYVEGAEEIEYIVENLLPKGSLILLYGPPGSGKSFLTLDLLAKVSENKKVFDYFNASQAATLLIDAENSPSLLRDRLRFLKGSGENILFMSTPFSITSKKNLDFLENVIMEKGVKLIVLDNFSSLNPKIDERDSIRVYHLLNNLRKIALKTHSCIILIHHVRKNQPFSISPLEEIRGSTVLSAVPDIVIKMEKLRDFFQFTVVKNRISNNFQSLLLELEEGGFRFLQNVEGGVDENMSACIRYVEEFAKTATGNVFSPKEIAESSHYSRNLIYKAISLLQATGKIRKIKRGFYKYVLQTTLSNPGDEEEYE